MSLPLVTLCKGFKFTVDGGSTAPSFNNIVISNSHKKRSVLLTDEQMEARIASQNVLSHKIRGMKVIGDGDMYKIPVKDI